jgi:N-acetylmuramoyl-L-alanine amidase
MAKKVSMNICLDSGHGGIQPGAVSSKYGYKEKDIVLDIALKVRDYLLYATKDGDNIVLNDHCPSDHKPLVDVIMTRETDKDVSLSDRCKIANNAKSRFFISIHCNSCNSEDPNGIETWCYESKNPEPKLLATNIQTSIMEMVKPYCLNIKGKDQAIRSRGVKQTTVYYTLRHTTMPSIVVECGFMSNPQEVSLMYNSEDYRIALSKGIAEGILKSL